MPVQTLLEPAATLPGRITVVSCGMCPAYYGRGVRLGKTQAPTWFSAWPQPTWLPDGIM